MNNVSEILDEMMKVFEKRVGKDQPGDAATALGMLLHLLVKSMVPVEGKEDLKKKEDEVIELVSLLIRGEHPVLKQMGKGKKK